MDAAFLPMAVGILNAGLKRWVDEQKEPPTPQEILKKSFELSFDESYTWHIGHSDHNARFSVGCGAAFIHFDDEHKRILERELKLLRTLNAAASGLPIDFSALLDEEPEINPDKMLKANSIFMDLMKEKKVGPFEEKESA